MVRFDLEKSPIYMMMLESVRRTNADILRDTPDCILLRDKPSGALMVAANSPFAAKTVTEGIADSGLLVTHDAHTYEAVLRIRPKAGTMICHQAIYYEDDIVQSDMRDIHLIERDRDISEVLDSYKGYDDIEYLTSLIKAGALYGAYQNGALAGYIGTHAEGSIGLLEVLPEFRRRGIGEALLRFMVRKHLDMGWRPFSQIVEANAVSVALHRKLGFFITNENLCWFI